MNVTPYAAAKIVNEVLLENNIKIIPPQMMYNYTSARVNAGKVPFIAWTSEDGVDLVDLERWTKAYIAKKNLGKPNEADVLAKFIAAGGNPTS